MRQPRTPLFILAVWILCMGVSAGSAQQEVHASKKVRTVPSDLDGDEAETADLYLRVLPSVVTLVSEGVELPGGRSAKTRVLGSGVLISSENHVLTAAHVVESARQLLVKTSDGVLRQAELLFSESSADIALLKLVEVDVDLSHAELGDSDQLAVGQRAFAIGSPYGLENTLSV